MSNGNPIFFWNFGTSESFLEWPSFSKSFGYAAPWKSESLRPFGFSQGFVIKRNKSGVCSVGFLENLIAAIGRKSKSFFKWPSIFQTMFDSGAACANLSFPFGKGKSLSIKRKFNTASPVSIVFRYGSPATIARRISAIVVDAINLMFGTRSFAHICKKTLKRIAPFFTNSETTPAIIFILWALVVVTPVFHANPDAKLWSFCHAMCFTASVSLGKSVSHTNELIKNKVIFNKITKKEG